MNIKQNPKLKPMSGPPRRPAQSGDAGEAVETPATDSLEKARPHEESGFQFKKAAFQFGLAMNTIAGAGAAAHAAEAEVVAQTHRELTQFLDLALESESVTESVHSFVKRDFTRQDALDSLEAFAEKGSLTGREGRTERTFTSSQAYSKLSNHSAVTVQLKDGRRIVVKDIAELQVLDTFSGLSLKPVAAPEVVDALRAFEKGIDADDGIVVDGAAFTSERKVSAYDAYKLLISQERGHGSDAAVKGGLIGLGTAVGVGALALGAAALGAGGGLAAVGPTLAALSGTTMAIAGGAAAAATVTGATVGYISYQNAHPDQLELRYGQDSGLMARTPEHAAEAYQWLIDRQANPFTDDQQREALRYLDSGSGLYQGRKELTPEEAFTRLHSGQQIQVKGPIPGRSDTIDNLRDLQVLDTVRGKGVNPVFSEDMRRSLRLLEFGQGADGYYSAAKIDPKSRLTAFEAVEKLFWERQPITTSLHGKAYGNPDLRSVQELNALKGDHINTILPQAEFDSLQLFDESHLLRSGNASVDSYEGLQALRQDQPIRVVSNDRQATIRNTTDLQELRAFEFTNRNDILDPLQFSMLQFWDHRGGYQVDQDGQADHAYEALQALQSGKAFEVKSEGRYAPAASYQDLQDLATFEAPEADFPNTVAAEAFDRLSYFQTSNEAAGGSTSRVAGRTGRAYEAYRQLRDGRPFELQAGGVWNLVENSQGLHDLDALLGRGLNDILPQEQYDLLKELADAPRGEGLSVENTRLNSYAVLQRFRQAQGVTYDFHGGDFGDLLRINTPNLDSLDDTQKLLHDQKEYDRYAPTVGEWQDKMTRQFERTPGLAQDNLRYGESELQAGEYKLSRGRSDLSDAEGDLRRAESDLSRARWELSSAYSMPYTVTKSRYECNSEGDCHTEYYEEHNYDRDWAISRAQSHVRSAEYDIDRAQSDISSAHRLISEAESDISRARGLIREARELIALLDGFRTTLGATTEANYQSTLASVTSTLARMESLSNIRSLDDNLHRQGQLIQNMSRPARPAGYKVPEHLVQS